MNTLDLTQDQRRVALKSLRARSSEVFNEMMELDYDSAVRKEKNVEYQEIWLLTLQLEIVDAELELELAKEQRDF